MRKSDMYMTDKDFLKQLDEYPHKVKYVKVITLTQDEIPIQSVEGLVNGEGSISISGTSALQRTISINFITNNIDVNNFNWCLNTKCIISIGLENHINDIYPDIIWFKQGVFVITGFTENISNNSHSISLTCKDKMVLLNGEVGGHITAASWDFGKEEILDYNGVITYRYITIKEIIRNAVKEFAQEPPQNIIINDLDTVGVELLTYKGEEPCYLIIDDRSNEVVQFTLDSSLPVYLNNSLITIGELNHYNPLSKIALFNTDVEIDKVYLDENDKEHLYTIAKVSYGETLGYRTTDLTYPGDLILQNGETIATLLNKLVSMLGNFEYYYDIDGHFVFQRQKIYTEVTFNNLVNTKDESYAANMRETSSVQYSFIGSNLVNTFTNTPQLDNLKNDYSIWGYRTSASNNNKIPIHIRYAIDKKPIIYTNFAGITYISDEKFYKQKKEEIFSTGWIDNDELFSYKYRLADWRELLYQMALDYRALSYSTDDFNIKLQENNGYDSNGAYWYPSGITGYEQYYTDIISFWRDIYCPTNDYYHYTLVKNDYNRAYRNEYYIRFYDKTKYKYHYIDIFKTRFVYKEIDRFDAANKIITDLEGNKHNLGSADYPWDVIYRVSDTGRYYFPRYETQIIESFYPYEFQEPEFVDTPYIDYTDNLGNNQVILPEYPLEQLEEDKVYYLIDTNKKKRCFVRIGNIIKWIDHEYNASTSYYKPGPYVYQGKENWHENVYEHPELLNFWFDLLDTQGEIRKYGVRVVGDRTKTVNKDSIKSIYFRDIPTLIVYDPKEKNEIERLNGYTYLQFPKYLSSLVSVSTQGVSAMDELDNLLYNNTYCADTISLTVIPVYYLKPNVRIFIQDDVVGISGEYIIDSLSIPLQYNGMMNISAHKAVERIY